MSITEQELEAAKALLREEFKSSLDAALQELSVQIKESHNQVVKAANDTFTEALRTIQETITAHDKSLKDEAATLSREAATETMATTASEHKEACNKALAHQLETFREEMALSLTNSAPAKREAGLSLRLEKHHLYLDELADRLGQPRMETN